jgi:hypothetical protein
MVFGAAVPALCALAGACSLTTSLSGLSNGPDDVDSGTDAANGVDGAMLAPEGGTDGGQDAGDGAATTQTFRCADHPGALFCADFDNGPFNVGWTDIYDPNGGTLALGDGRFGRGLVATIPTHGATTPSTRPGATLETGVNLPARAPFTFAFDTKIESAAPGGGVYEISGIFFHVNFYVVTFRIEDSGAIVLHEYGDPIGSAPFLLNDFPLMVGPPIGSWVHVAMQMTFPSSSSVHLRVQFDGAIAYDGAIGASPYASPPFVYGGISNAENAGQARAVDFDDIVVTTP